MAIRNTKLGGVSWTAEHPTYQDLNDTNNTIINQSILVGENAVRVLQSNNVYTNGPNIVVDEMTDSNGTKNTVNTGTSTSIYSYDNSYYHMQLTGDASNDTENAESSLTTTGSSSASSGYRILATSNCVLVSVTKASASTATRARLLSDNGTQIATATFSGDVATFSTAQSLVDTFNYRIEVDNNGSSYTRARNGSPSYTYTGVNINFTTGSEAGSDVASNAYNIVSCITQNATFSSSTVIVDASTTTLDGNEKGFVISVPDSSFPTNTSITATISDGTSSLTATAIDTISKGVVIGNPGTLSSGTLECTFTLATTDTSVTPTLPSYAISILR